MQKKATSKSNAQRAPVEPLADRVLIQPLEENEEKTSAAGIILPESAENEKTRQGDVVAVGPGKRDENGEHIAPAVSIGDRVVFSRYGYDEVEFDGQEYYIVAEANILAKIA